MPVVSRYSAALLDAWIEGPTRALNLYKHSSQSNGADSVARGTAP